MSSDQKNIAWISCLRACAMAMIVLCHIMSQSGSAFGNIAAQFLNVGVEIFFLISGYLFGLKYISIGYGKWIGKRMMRLAPAYYIFLAILAIVHLILGIHQSLRNWLISLFFLQATEYYLLGAEHLWFLTVMLACYLITPILDMLKRKDETSSRYLLLFLLFSAALQILVTVLGCTQLGRYWHLLNLYMVAYILGSRRFICKNKHTFWAGSVMGLSAILLRLFGRQYWDATVFYNLYVVGLTHAVLACSIMMIFQYCIRKTPGKAVSFFDQISYEVYLVHFMFISGPISLMHLTNSFMSNSLLACLCTVATAKLIHDFVNLLPKKFR